MKKPCMNALAVLLCLGALVSCGTDGSTPAVTDDTAADTVVTTAETEPEITSGNPADLDLGGETIHLWYTTGWDSYTDIAGAQF